MSNSPLIDYTKISPNSTNPRNHEIDTITIHCMAGNHTVEKCGELFASELRDASSNYGIDSEGRIGMYVEEKNRSWCSSSPENDHRAVTIEVANDGLADTGWHVSDKALASLIKLVADVCKRNNIKELKWKGDKSLIGKINEQNMTVHRWFKNKACPGDYLYGKHPYIAAEVNKKLIAPVPKPVVKTKEQIAQENFVKKVQKELKLPVTGKADANLLKKTPTIKRGDNGNMVRIIQARLKELGYKLGVDGSYGEGKHHETYDQIIKYQKKIVKLKNPDGEFTSGQQSWKKILGL